MQTCAGPAHATSVSGRSYELCSIVFGGSCVVFSVSFVDGDVLSTGCWTCPFIIRVFGFSLSGFSPFFPDKMGVLNPQFRNFVQTR